MRCSDVTSHASDLIDGKLSRRAALRLRLHLLFCNGCARFVRQMRQTRDLTRAAFDRTPPPSAEAIDAILKKAGRGGEP